MYIYIYIYDDNNPNTILVVVVAIKNWRSAKQWLVVGKTAMISTNHGVAIVGRVPGYGC